MERPGNHAVFRPPAEAFSLVLRVADGCPWNRCAFCGMYKGIAYRTFPPAALRDDIARCAREAPQERRIFLADGDVMALPFNDLTAILDMLRRSFPSLKRVSMYANGHSLLTKTADQLRELRGAGLHTVYMGLESGSDTVLELMNKRESAAEMVAAVQHAQACGLRASVMVLTGLGGTALSTQHADETVHALNRMQPRLLAALRVVPVPGTELAERVADGRFAPLTELAAVRELRHILAGLTLRRTVFSANHTSNVVPLQGRLPRDRERLLAHLDRLLAMDVLDPDGPGPQPLWL